MNLPPMRPRCAQKWRTVPPLIAALAAGCAAPDAARDYRRAEALARQSTGQPNAYRPDDEAFAARRAAELAADGIRLDEAVQIALLNNPRWQAAVLEIGLARAQVAQSALFSNPRLALSLRLPSGGGLANLEASLVQNLAELWLIPPRVRAAEHELERTICDLSRRAHRLALDVRAAYYRAAAADRIRELAAETTRIAGEFEAAARARLAAGAGSELDVNLARAELADAVLSERRAELEALEQRRSLLTLLGLRIPPGELKLLDGVPEPGAAPLSPERAVALAESRRFDLLAARQALTRAEQRVELEKRAALRVLELGVALERSQRQRIDDRNLLFEAARASAAAGAPTAPDLSPRPREGTDLIVGPTLAIELPVFDRNQAQIAAAEIAREQAAKALEALRVAAFQEVWTAAEAARIRCELLRQLRTEALPLRESNLHAVRLAYESGGTPITVVLEAQRSLLAARAGYVEALRDAAVASGELEAAVGVPLAELFETDR